MANRQEEFLEKLETEFQVDFIKCYSEELGKEMEESPKLYPKISIKELIKATRKLVKVRRRDNSVFLRMESPAGQTEIIAEKSNNDLVIVSEGFKRTLRDKIISSYLIGMLLFLLPMILILVFWMASTRPEKLVHPPDWKGALLITLGGEAFMISLVLRAWKAGKRSLRRQNFVLGKCMQKTIDSFK